MVDQRAEVIERLLLEGKQIIGMLGQPFWFYASWKAEQWGIFAVSVLYALAWMKGLWVHWLQPGHDGLNSDDVRTIELAPDTKR